MALPGSNLPVSLIYSALGVSNGREIFYIGETLKTKTQLEALVNKNLLDATYCPGADADARITNLLADRRLSYLKGYGTVVDITVTYDLSTTITTKTNTSLTQDYWRRVDILPIDRSGATINFKAAYDLSKGPGALTEAKFYYGVGASSTVEPPWVQIDLANSSGTGTVVVISEEYLFVRLVATRKDEGIDDWAEADITLIDGNVIAPNTGTVTASGSPLTWNVPVGSVP